MIASGQLNSRITIERRSAARDGIGQPVVGWASFAVVWASIKHPSGLQAIKASADVSTVHASIRIRYRAGIDASMRVVHGADIYDIRAVLTNRPAGYIDLVCEAIK